MFLTHQPSGKIVEILDLHTLWDPFEKSVTGRFHAGEELQDPEPFTKTHLIFPSGEALPICWRDPNYRENMAESPTVPA